MRAAVIPHFGPPEVLTVKEIPTPAAGEGEILVRVRAIGVNFADVFARLGVYPGIPNPPFVPGIEYAGTVENTGHGVRGFRRGQKVFGFTRQNGYAEFVCVPAQNATPMPAHMSFEEAAAFTVAYLTAYHGLVNLAHATRGEKVLIHAAAGGVGIASIQIAKALGLEVFATVGSDEKARVAREQGADHVINYRAGDFAEAVRRISLGYGVDIVMDGVAGPAYRKGLKLMAPMGRYIMFGVSAVNAPKRLNFLRIVLDYLTAPRILLSSQIRKNVGYHAFNLYFLTHKTDLMRSSISALLAWYRQGALKPLVSATFGLDQVVDVHRLLQSRKAVGRIVIIP